MTASLTATGSSITVSNASLSTSEFTVSGISLPLTLAAGKTASFTVNFKPQSSGVATASGSFISNAANASVAQTLSGTGAAAPQHSVALSWNPSPPALPDTTCIAARVGRTVRENHLHEPGHHLYRQLGSVRPDLLLRHHRRGWIRERKRELEPDPGRDSHSLGLQTFE